MFLNMLATVTTELACSSYMLSGHMVYVGQVSFMPKSGTKVCLLGKSAGTLCILLT